ncbi:MAG: hypothetical protein Q9170_002307 [Blastenia crenularia]
MSTEIQNSTPTSPPSPSSIYHQLESYPFTTDPEFQSGLSKILSSSSTSQNPEPLTLRARCFYFSRKQNVPIDFDSYVSWRAAQDLPPVTAPLIPTTEESPIPEARGNGVSSETSRDAGQNQQKEQPSAPYPSSFSEIVELITKGEPIPGIKDVPDTLLTGQESTAVTAKRKKPWEKDQVVAKAEETTFRDRE